MRIFIICPVRDVTEEEKQFIENYVHDLEQQGHRVHWPQRDTNQIDETGGIQICIDNKWAITYADEVHVFWNGKSQGSFFDLGMTFSLQKPIKLINKVEWTQGKSFNNVLIHLNTAYEMSHE
jgi:hypothetical protein